MTQRRAYTRVVKPGDKGTQTFSPSADLKKLVDDYLKKVQKEIDSGKDANTAFKTKPDLDDLTGNELIELLFYNEKLGDAPIKELNYLDLFSIIQNLLEKKVWELAVQWWGKQETQHQKDTTETVVERPKAAMINKSASNWKQQINRAKNDHELGFIVDDIAEQVGGLSEDQYLTMDAWQLRDWAKIYNNKEMEDLLNLAINKYNKKFAATISSPSDVELRGIEFASGQEPEDNDFIALVTVRFAVSGQSLASLVGKQRRVLFRFLTNATQRQLLSTVLNSRELLTALKPKIKRFVNEYFVYDLDMDPPRRLNISWTEESDYPYSAEVHAGDETVIFEVELDVMGN